LRGDDAIGKIGEGHVRRRSSSAGVAALSKRECCGRVG
jgi:hypothetical protein